MHNRFQVRRKVFGNSSPCSNLFCCMGEVGIDRSASTASATDRRLNVNRMSDDPGVPDVALQSIYR
jgi:hypothetical protein